MPLSDVLHQEAAMNRLQRALSSRRMPHAYLFTGPNGVGKELLANRLAQQLLCSGNPVNDTDSGGLFGGEGAESESTTSRHTLKPACGTCVDCALFAAGNHPDYHRIHRALNKVHPDKTVQRRKAIDLGVDVVRHFVLERIMLHASRGQAKVFVIVEADRLSVQAQNALLKTLEEPPGLSYLILLATSPDELLATTRSRCQHIPFGTLPDTFIAERLQRNRNLSHSDTTILTQLAQGSLGTALRYADMGIHERLGAILGACKAAVEDPLGAGKALAELAKDLASTGKDADTDEEGDTNAAREAQALVLSIVGTVLRDVQRVVAGSTPMARPGDPLVLTLAARCRTRPLAESLRALSTAEYQIDQNANAGLIFDAVGIALHQGLSGAAP